MNSWTIRFANKMEQYVSSINELHSTSIEQKIQLKYFFIEATDESTIEHHSRVLLRKRFIAKYNLHYFFI